MIPPPANLTRPPADALPWRRISPAGLVSAAGFLVCLFTLAGFAGRWHWTLEITSHFRAQYAVLLLGAGLMLLGWRRRWQAGALLAAAAVNAFTLLPFLRGTPAEAATFGPPPVRLLAWNVNSANRQFGELDRLLRAHDPDVVVVLEVDPAWQRHLEGALAGYPHRQIEARDDNFGLAFFSRTPAFQLRTEHLGAAGLPSIAAELDVDGRRLALLATHPLPPAGGLRTQYRDEQLQAIAEWVRRQDQPVVVVGDLNISPWSPVFTDFLDASGLRNSAEGRGLQGTWPAFFPPLLIPIDHFLHDTGVLVAERAVVRARGSDHRPLVVTFGLR